ncbi:RNA polymerase sigma factor [Pedobacter metabolipauper]|uniref:RNA polymerase sigma-70 factor (ECF subfamily) n=1 Tax=Pedobacter metabolipauper TaxID=425513 RepID=A0A4R6SUF2_9SPHI|nr:RNA polymerase sigma-70 factor [Pedobacter metabolipauper]TDQ08658.1 RNA polymerase sigma-70 factor (ECF subfamily) [Pedobacter metabolipauper]
MISAHHSLTDLQLADLLQEDDQTAFAEIYNRYAERLTGFASSKLYNLDDARDIIHDVFVRLWEERKQLTINRNLEAYLFTIVRYRIVDKIRKNITREDYMEMVLALQTSPGSDVEQQIAAKELKQQIDGALDKLSPRVKEIYHLSREENLSISEIAVKLDLSEQTVKNQLTFALKHLRTSLTYLSTTALIFWCLH